MKSLSETDRDYFYDLILETNGNTAEAARIAKTSRDLVSRRIAAHGLKEHLRVTRELHKAKQSKAKV